MKPRYVVRPTGEGRFGLGIWDGKLRRWQGKYFNTPTSHDTAIVHCEHLNALHEGRKARRPENTFTKEKT